MANTAWTAERLKDECPYIECDNLDQRGEVFNKLEGMGFKLFGWIKTDELFVEILDDIDYGTSSSTAYGYKVIPASEFLTQPNPELTALKKRLLEIADNVGGEYTKEVQYFTALHQYINLDNETICTALANLIINSDI